MARRRTYPRKHREFLDANRHHYDLLLSYQDGKCAICGRLPSDKRKFDLDHHHAGMFMRGLLCVRCNIWLRDGMTPEWCAAAGKYVDERGPDWFEKLVNG